MSFDCFANYQKAQVWYHPLADRLFIFHEATFLGLPCLEREDGKKMICNHPYDVNAGLEPDETRHLIKYIGEL